MKKTLVLFFLFEFFLKQMVCAQILQTNSDRFMNAVNSLKVNPSQQNVKDVIGVFEDLRKTGYEKSYPLLNYYEGKAHRLLGRFGGKDAEGEFLKAIDEFEEYKNFALKKRQRTEYKASIIMLSYTYADLGNLTGEFKKAKDEIINFINDKTNHDLLDGSVTLCEADVFNASGFYRYVNHHPVEAVEDFEVACGLMKIGWPIFANNYINACVDAFDLTKDKRFLNKARAIYLIHWNKSYWYGEKKFEDTGELFEKYCKNNGVTLPTRKRE